MNNDQKLEGSEEFKDTPNHLENYELEVKQGFFSKLFSTFKNKALPSGEPKHIQPSNFSITSMIRFGSFRTKLFNIFETMQKLLNLRKESIVENTLSPHIIREDDLEEQIEESVELVEEFDKPQIIIPKSKQNPVMAQNIINNSKTENESHTDLKDLEIEEIDIDQAEPDKAPLQIESIEFDKSKDNDKTKNSTTINKNKENTDDKEL